MSTSYDQLPLAGISPTMASNSPDDTSADDSPVGHVWGQALNR